MTLMKMFAATIPTKVAAHHSIASMMRSIELRRDATSEAGLVLRDRRLERFHHRLGVVAGLGGARGPLRFGRRDRLAPRLELLGSELVDHVSGLGGELGAAAVLEISPGRGALLGPFGL